jgi:hypothetical protein
MPDEGLKRKYRVEKIEDREHKHLNCWFFVLDPEHDEAALIALESYARAVRRTHPQLSSDLMKKVASYVQ